MSTENKIISQLPGIFYRKPSPNEVNFVEEGQNVVAGQVIGLVELMKQYIEVQTEHSGKIVSFETANGDEVDSGQVIAIIETEE